MHCLRPGNALAPTGGSVQFVVREMVITPEMGATDCCKQSVPRCRQDGVRWCVARRLTTSSPCMRDSKLF